jgi:hypothetical protein
VEYNIEASITIKNPILNTAFIEKNFNSIMASTKPNIVAAPKAIVLL